MAGVTIEFNHSVESAAHLQVIVKRAVEVLLRCNMKREAKHLLQMKVSAHDNFGCAFRGVKAVDTMARLRFNAARNRGASSGKAVQAMSLVQHAIDHVRSELEPDGSWLVQIAARIEGLLPKPTT